CDKQAPALHRVGDCGAETQHCLISNLAFRDSDSIRIGAQVQLFPNPLIRPHIWCIFWIALQIIALDMFVTRGNESKTCRVGRINQLWCGLWSIDHDSKPRKGILLFHAQSSCTGDELAGQRLRTISADHKIGAEYSRSAIRG